MSTSSAQPPKSILIHQLPPSLPKPSAQHSPPALHPMHTVGMCVPHSSVHTPASCTRQDCAQTRSQFPTMREAIIHWGPGSL